MDRTSSTGGWRPPPSGHCSVAKSRDSIGAVVRAAVSPWAWPVRVRTTGQRGEGSEGGRVRSGLGSEATARRHDRHLSDDGVEATPVLLGDPSARDGSGRAGAMK